jgi:hypothetical protein
MRRKRRMRRGRRRMRRRRRRKTKYYDCTIDTIDITLHRSRSLQRSKQ